MVDIVAYGAHPDDLELGIGGTLIAHVRQGWNVVGIDMTRGEMGSNGTPEERVGESNAAAEVMGLSSRPNLDLPDMGIAVEDKQLRVVVDSIRRLRPKILIAPYWHSHHPDHENAGHLLRKAFFVSGLKKFKTESSPYRPGAIYYYALPRDLKPTLIVDITPYFEEKLEAIKQHVSQFRRDGETFPTNINSPGFQERIKGANLYWGRQAGVQYGEPLFSPRPPRVKNLFWGEKEK